MREYRKRNSSVELLKIIAIILIVFSHAMPDDETLSHYSSINLNIATKDIQYFIISLIHNMGQIGNDIFLVCSSWFLIESEKVNKNKILYMIGDCVTISIGMLLVFMLLGYKLSNGYIVKQFFPITFGNYWFITCYILLYLIHPLLNVIIKNITQSALLVLNCFFIVLYCLISFSTYGYLFFYSPLIGFVGIYFLVAYMKKYMQRTINNRRKGINILGVGILGWLIQNIVILGLALNTGFLSKQVHICNQFINLFYILIAVGALIISNNCMLYSKKINYYSAMSLIIYVIHCNRIVRDYVRFDVFDYILTKYSYEHILLWVLVFAIISLMITSILAFIYMKCIHEKIKKICDMLFIKINPVCVKIEEWLLNID